MRYTPQNKSEMKVDCKGCSVCCEFVLLKVERPSRFLKIHKIISRNKKGDLLIIGDRKGYDRTFFGFHNIKVTPSKEIMLYTIPPAYPVYWKAMKGEFWIKVCARCKKLNKKTKLCKIYNRRPEVCKVAKCVLQEPNYKGDYETGWQKL